MPGEDEQAMPHATRARRFPRRVLSRRNGVARDVCASGVPPRLPGAGHHAHRHSPGGGSPTVVCPPTDAAPGPGRPMRRDGQQSGKAPYLCRFPRPAFAPCGRPPLGWYGGSRLLGAEEGWGSRAVVVACLRPRGPWPRLMGRLGVTSPGGGRLGLGARGRSGTACVAPHPLHRRRAPRACLDWMGPTRWWRLGHA
jgi:hypothetical protein